MNRTRSNSSTLRGVHCPVPQKLISATLGFIVFAFCFPAWTAADVLWLKDGATLYGRILEQSDTVRFRVCDEDGNLGKIETLAANQVVGVRRNIDPVRLGQLSVESGSVRGYIEYAEELSAERRDPVARNLARRLYLLAAAHGSETETRSALLGLSGLVDATKSNDAQRRIQVLLLLHSEQGDESELKSGAARANGLLSDRDQKVPTPTEADLRTMLRLVQAIRQDRTQAAIRLLNQSDRSAVWSKWEQQITQSELNTMARKGRLSPIDLRRLLSIELSIEKRLARNEDLSGQREPKSKPRPTAGKTTWAEQAYQASTDAVVLPSIESLAESLNVNLGETQYRNGQWRVPAKAKLE